MTELSDLERAFLTRLIQLAPDLPTPVPQFRFSKTRKWTFDWCFRDEKVAVECEGGIFIYGRHNRAAGYAADCEKYNAAALDGWLVLRYTSDQLRDDPARVIFEVETAIQRAQRQRQAHDNLIDEIAALQAKIRQLRVTSEVRYLGDGKQSNDET